MKLFHASIIFILLFGMGTGFAQTFSISGRIVDSLDASGLVSVSCAVMGITDTSVHTGTVTDIDGHFELTNLAPGRYKIKFEYLGYTAVTKTATVAADNVDLGIIKMSTTSKELKGVTIKGTETRAKQLGDTTQFNAKAYKVHADANAEDLVSKLPGVTSDNTGVKVNGEAIQQVLVDGKPFFGNDPTLALRNLPAEVIDNIQIFDKMSDQASFTGFDDGTSQKSMNISTRANKQEGQFGRAYAGYGTDGRYLAGGNLNIFHHETRVSILGLFNNINQQNFSSQDVLGISSGSSGGGSGGFGRGRGGSGGGNNFMSGQQNGIAQTNSVGLNYTDKWGKKIKVTGSYFFNNTDTKNNIDATQNYTTADSQVYKSNSSSEAINSNHRFNLRMEYAVDSMNTLIFTPAVNLQQNNTSSSAQANTSILSRPSSFTNNSSGVATTGYNSSGNLLWQHKFSKVRRTIAISANANLNEKGGNGTYLSQNNFLRYNDSMNRYDTTPTSFDQHYDLYNNTNTISGNVTYTEPMGKKGQLMLTYNPSVSKSKSDKETYNKNATDNTYTVFDNALSNKYENTYSTQKAGISLRQGNRKLNYNIGLSGQYALLEGTQHFPYAMEVSKPFYSLLPNAQLNRQFNDGRNLRINYRTNTDAPSISQLQSVADVTNPLQIKTGNPELKQNYEQTFMVRYGQARSKSDKNFFSNLYVNYVNNYIGNASYLFNRDTVIRDTFTHTSIALRKGSQLSRPVNLDGYWNMRSFFTYGMPVKPIKCNLNATASFNFTRTPGMINDVVNYSNNYIPSAGLVISSNISEQVDFTASYTGNYNIIQNTSLLATNATYYSSVASFKANYVVKKKLVLNASLNHNYYTAFSSTANQSFLLVNAFIGYKFLKNNALEARITAFDLLNQNKSIIRTVTANYIENDQTLVLKQYLMFQLTYTIRNFKGIIPEETKNPLDNVMPPGGWKGRTRGGQ